MKFQPYSSSEIDILMKEPWEISDQPYQLHAAFALCTLADLYSIEGDEEEDEEEIWGQRIPKKTLDRLVVDIASDFNDAASNHKPIRIWGKPYSIRKVNAYDKERLIKIFDFPIDNGEYVITKEGVMDLSGISIDPANYESAKEESKENRTYLRQIIMLAEDDKNNGWDMLTDMEILIYCWALYYNKNQDDNFVRFKAEYKDYIYVQEKDILTCITDKSMPRNKPVGMYGFSKRKTEVWNKLHKQTSKASNLDEKAAEDYWYEIALKSTFKPIDQK